MQDGARMAAKFPFLSPEEFVEACHYFDRRYRQAKLGMKRMQWKVQIRTANSALFDFTEAPNTWLEITQSLQNMKDDVDLDLDGLDLGGQGNNADQEMMETEAADTAMIQRAPEVREDSGSVKYEIIWHPTYKVPVLYFSLYLLPHGEDRYSVDTVFSRLVPQAYKDGLRMGGISLEHNPVAGWADAPCFMVHPCLISEGMAAFRCSLEEYLTVWIGLAGACVGLSVPIEMVPRQRT